MIVSINIVGLGSVVGAGEYGEGEIVSLSATPDDLMEFKGWNGSIKDNPYSFSIESDKTFTAKFYLPIEEVLKGLIGYPVTDSQINAILVNRNIPFKSDSDDLSLRQKDLAYADLIMLVVAMPSFGAEEDQMGNWKRKGKSVTVTGKSNLIQIAKAIYSKYGLSISGNRIIDRTNRW